jgi:hypothetical protein
MKNQLFLFILSFLSFCCTNPKNGQKNQNIISDEIDYCDCQIIHRDDGTEITQCISLPVARDSSLELGLSIASNEQDIFITTSIRFFESAKEINGNLSIRLHDNNLVTFTLVNKGLAYIGNSQVSQAVFALDEDKIQKLKSSDLLTVSLKLDRFTHTLECKENSSILKKQLDCLSGGNDIDQSYKKDNLTKGIQHTNTSSAWIVKNAEIGNFQLSFPNNPDYTKGKFHGWRSTDKSGKVIYMMSYLEAPPKETLTMVSIEKYLLPSLFEGDTKLSQKNLTYSGYSALDFYYKTNNNPSLLKKGRVVIKGQKIYLLQIHYYDVNLIQLEKYLNSLKFL